MDARFVRRIRRILPLLRRFTSFRPRKIHLRRLLRHRADAFFVRVFLFLFRVPLRKAYQNARTAFGFKPVLVCFPLHRTTSRLARG